VRRPRPLWSRALIAIWGIWFAAALLEPGGLHSCPLHGGAGHVHGGMSGMHDMHAMHGTSAPAHWSTEHVSGTDSPSHRSSDVCTCLGLCCCVPVVALASQVAALPGAATVDVEAPTYREFSAPRIRRAHALPFANGPPTLVG
jgi:hypothetical protein